MQNRMHQKNTKNCKSLQHWKNFRWKVIEVVYVHYILHTFTIWKICVYVYIYICTRLNQLHVLFLVHIPTHWWRKDLSRARGNTVIVTAKFRRSWALQALRALQAHSQTPWSLASSPVDVWFPMVWHSLFSLGWIPQSFTLPWRCLNS